MNRAMLCRKLGHYQVGPEVLINKVDAMMRSSSLGIPMSWHFNDDVFGAIDWKTPIETPLSVLYRQRAIQLREQYDYISLFFSGGVDSANALHSFIDNGIPIDEIVMYLPEAAMDKMSNTQDRSGANIFSELKFAATPHLKKYVLDNNIKIRFIDLATATSKFFNSPDLPSQYVNSTYNIQSYIVPRISMIHTDPEWLSLYASNKKVCHLQGVDKPVINYSEALGYHFRFQNSMQYAMEPMYETELTGMLAKQQFHELFYWTPDLPQLVIKQCQMVKGFCQTDPMFRVLMKLAYEQLGQDGLTFINRIVYPPHVLAIRDLFHTKKVVWGARGDAWNWRKNVLSTSNQGAFNEFVGFAQKRLDPKFFLTKYRWWTDHPSKPDQPSVDVVDRDAGLAISRSRTYSL